MTGSRFIHGLHELGGQHLMPNGGWIVFTVAVGHNPDDLTGFDFRPWANWGIIVRVNHGYGKAGTVPMPEFYPQFAQRVQNFVAASQGCDIWIVANECNHSQERPNGYPIYAVDYARCFNMCKQAIVTLPNHAQDQVAIAAIAPWNTQTGDWLDYFSTVLALTNPTAIALHTYTHGSDPSLIFSEMRMNPPYQDRRFHFRAYRDFMARIPSILRDLPVYITETDQNVAWKDVNVGWVQNAYREINDWNQIGQKIRALVLYRWPRYDQWYIDGKTGVHADFQAAVAKGYTWQVAEIPKMWTESEIRTIVREEIEKHDGIS